MPRNGAKYDRNVTIVEQMPGLNLLLPGVGTDQEKRRISVQIEQTDRATKALIDDPYGLTPEEIAIGEGRS